MFNFENPGNKIQKAAKVIRIIGFIIIWLYDLIQLIYAMISNIKGVVDNSIALAMVFSTLLVFVVGTFSVWLSTLILYAFGQFVENSGETAQNTKIIAELSQKTKPINADTKEIPDIYDNI